MSRVKRISKVTKFYDIRIWDKDRTVEASFRARNNAEAVRKFKELI